MDQGFKLYYFPGNARGMISRAIFYAAKKPFEDIKVAFADWPAMKSSGKFEFQQLPLLEYQGRSYAQSHAIEQYLAKSFGLFGKNVEDEYQINSIIDSYDDLFNVFHDIVWPVPSKPVEEVKKAYQAKAELFLKAYEKRYQILGAKAYFLGDYFSLADVALTAMFTYFSDYGLEEGTIKKCAPKLAELLDRIKSNELKEFYEKGYVKGSKF